MFCQFYDFKSVFDVSKSPPPFPFLNPAHSPAMKKKLFSRSLSPIDTVNDINSPSPLVRCRFLCDYFQWKMMIREGKNYLLRFYVASSQGMGRERLQEMDQFDDPNFC